MAPLYSARDITKDLHLPLYDDNTTPQAQLIVKCMEESAHQIQRYVPIETIDLQVGGIYNAEWSALATLPHLL